MKIAFQLAYKNLIGAGLRTWLNVGVLAFAFLIILFYNGLMDGWNQQAKRDTIDWEYGQGQFLHPDYDPLDPFTIKDGHGFFEPKQQPNLIPIFIRQASIYPEGRLLPIALKGIDPNQTTLSLPTQALQNSKAEIPVLIGKQMAMSTHLQVGDQVLLRWRDKNGTFDAANMTVVSIFDTDVPTVDKGQVWMPIEKLWTLTGLSNEATLLVANSDHNEQHLNGWVFHSQEELLSDITELIAMKKTSGYVLYLLLLAIALLAIFDTQVLSVFRRQKEIGTYIALGMTRQQVVGIFTVEGSMYSLFAMLLGCLIGIPLFGYLAKIGIAFPQQDIGIAMGERIFPTFGPLLVLSTIALVVLSATIVSFLPARKIAKMNPVDALKGILRDKSRSILPVIIIAIGVGLTVLLSAYMKGAFGDMIDQNARFETGHVKIMSRAYADNKDQLPNDLALLEISPLIQQLQADFPNMQWTKRIRFGGILDVPDENGETKGQGPVAGMAFDLFNQNSGEAKRLNMASALVSGAIPTKSGETLLGHDFANKLDLSLGDTLTFFGTTMNNSMTFHNFVVKGTIRFGAAALDRGAMIIDVSDAQLVLDMEDGAGEILGFSHQSVYNNEQANALATQFNASFASSKDEFAPQMFTLKQQNNLGPMIDYSNTISSIFVFIFVFAMSIVLWNTGLLGGLRRYQEFGIRLALGESKGHIYRSLVVEAILIGFLGSVVGITVGLVGAWYLQVYGIDISGMMDKSSMLVPAVLRAKITPELFFIGFIPGVLAMVLGNMLSGIGIYQRETAHLFKELEV